ncbi:hypothetical protein PISMIDRAFT_99678 [Pisolithus microcarpus 441]|uniref:ATP-dependent DNA helicase n=1 Tax=Pisolithus microcarpus 441 TaxID=765257 RepID=A0A0C9ZWK7_9AGAM|nr:hypothetical protein PISMIDRAFT_99678 [Pisolithus microcarpus 441]
MSDRVLEVKILGGDYDGNTAFIPRISLIPSTSTTDFTFLLSRRQFPVRLAFAMSINKAQGQSVKHVGIDLRTPVFSHGQLYVALSRATSSRRVKVLLPSEGGNKTLNVVYPEVLLWYVSSSRNLNGHLEHIPDCSSQIQSQPEVVVLVCEQVI